MRSSNLTEVRSVDRAVLKPEYVTLLSFYEALVRLFLSKRAPSARHLIRTTSPEGLFGSDRHVPYASPVAILRPGSGLRF